MEIQHLFSKQATFSLLKQLSSQVEGKELIKSVILFTLLLLTTTAQLNGHLLLIITQSELASQYPAPVI